jgi:hypothetical protein
MHASPVQNSPYYSGVETRQRLRRLGLRIGEQFVEVTCLPEEVAACRAWLERGDILRALPGGEYREPPWGLEYRWTWRAEMAHREGVAAKTA